MALLKKRQGSVKIPITRDVVHKGLPGKGRAQDASEGSLVNENMMVSLQPITNINTTIASDEDRWMKIAGIITEGKGLVPDGPYVSWKANKLTGCIGLSKDEDYLYLQAGGVCTVKPGSKPGGTTVPIKISSDRGREVVKDLKVSVKSGIKKNWKWLNHYSNHLLGPHK